MVVAPGVTLTEDGIAVAIPSQHATAVYLCLFGHSGDTEQHRITLERQGTQFTGFVPGVKAGMRYGLRAEGPWAPEAGHRFDVSKLLVDPWAAEIDRPYAYDPVLGVGGIDTAAHVPKAIVRKPISPVSRKTPHAPRWIYELPVKAFSKLHPDVPEEKRGTVAALAEPALLAHLARIGADTIELMPLAAWIDERHLPPLGLSNGWGYNPVTFFAADPRLAPGGFAEIARTVKALHDKGFQVIVDVVLNHTGESDIDGPTLSFRGLDHRSWYAHAGGNLINDTGCGNTVALNEAMVTGYAVAALRHWVEATGIDGFRFDLATVMGRMADGFSRDAPLFQRIANDPVLRDCVMIAEPWDIGPGGYQLGHFPRGWPEWNDRFRDDVRRFWRGDAYGANAMATRLAGSSDIFQAAKSPAASVNFIAAHDGFTLADLTRYTQKDNFANGEDNRDGKSDEVTTPGRRPEALLASLFFARGTPMLTAGDEFGRSQQGNNNAYAQDNALTWLHWGQANQMLIDTVALLSRLRQAHPLLAADRFLNGEGDALWFNAAGSALDWTAAQNRFLGLLLSGDGSRIAIAANLSETDLPFPLPAAEGLAWRRAFPPGAASLTCPAGSASLFIEEKA
ncbi:MAG: glycogen debranching protein GlgX [Proteobacteria bacterium]|nr:glycogen debranching protein GlgX [Pseudomonadota bacterium]